MANTVTLSIKTDPETKALIQQAAERIGLSVNSFVLMVAKNAAESDEIVIKNPAATERRTQEMVLEARQSLESAIDWEYLKAQYPNLEGDPIEYLKGKLRMIPAAKNPMPWPPKDPTAYPGRTPADVDALYEEMKGDH